MTRSIKLHLAVSFPKLSVMIFTITQVYILSVPHTNLVSLVCILYFLLLQLGHEHVFGMYVYPPCSLGGEFKQTNKQIDRQINVS